MQYSRTLGYSPTGLCRILPQLRGMDTLLGCFFLNAHQVVGHLGHKDTVAILQSHMIQINLTVGIKQHKRIDRFSWGSNALFLLLGKRSFGRGGYCYGNLLVGPNAQDIEDKEDTQTTQEGIDDIKKRALLSVPNIPYNKMITSFSGLRAHAETGDFILGEACDGFFDCAGIESPGLTSAPAIGEYLSDLVAEKYGFKKKENFIETRKGFIEAAKLPKEERTKLIAEHPEYGRIVCRCENISEGEILDAIRRTPGARSMDGIKRRVRQGMGRCQAGFCTPKAMEILARELGIPMTSVAKNRPGSELLKAE